MPKVVERHETLLMEHLCLNQYYVLEAGKMIEIKGATTLATMPIPLLHRDTVVNHFPSVYEKMFQEVAGESAAQPHVY